MKNNKKKTFNLLTILLAVVAVCLLLVGGIGGTRAVLIESDTYSGTLNTPTVSVELHENDSDEPVTTLLSGMLGENEKLALGKQYDEKLTVVNSGSTEQYVRVTFYKYWTEGEENKRVDLDPSYIQLIQGNEDWILDGSMKTAERLVYYYKFPVAVDGETSSVIDKIAVNGEVANLVKQTIKTVDDNHTTITTTYKYDGLDINLEASVDAIQTHHAEDAMKASWGVSPSFDADGNLQSIN